MYYLWVDNILFSVQYMTIQKFLIPDGIEYYDNKQALLFENIRSSALNIFKKYKLADAKQAHEDLEARRLKGPVILIP